MLGWVSERRESKKTNGITTAKSVDFIEKKFQNLKIKNIQKPRHKNINIETKSHGCINFWQQSRTKDKLSIWIHWKYPKI